MLIILLLPSCSTTVKNTHIPTLTTCKIAKQIPECSLQNGHISIIGHKNDIGALSDKVIHDFLIQINQPVYEIYIENLYITNLEFLCELGSWVNTVTSIELTNCNHLNSIEYLSNNCPHLEELLIFYSPDLTNIDAVSNNSELRLLNVSSCGLSDISQITNLPQLTTLVLIDNNITDISLTSEGFPNLKGIILSQNKISTISSISDIPSLELIDLAENPLIFDEFMDVLLSGKNIRNAVYYVSTDSFTSTQVELLEALAEDEDIFVILA